MQNENHSRLPVDLHSLSLHCSRDSFLLEGHAKSALLSKTVEAACATHFRGQLCMCLIGRLDSGRNVVELQSLAILSPYSPRNKKRIPLAEI